MALQWEPETQYNNGDIVVFEGVRYKIVQPHMSQADWTPPVTPALWARLPQESGGDDTQAQPQQSYGDDNNEKRWDEHQAQQVEINKEEQQKHWYDLDEKRKHELEIGGGLAAGAALLAGGYAAYRHHGKKSEEERKAQVWSAQNWLTEAQARTQDYYHNAPRGPVAWILVHGKNIPQSAIPGGEENGQPLFICRAFHEGSIQVGKASPALQEGGSVGFGNQEINVNTYEVLVGDVRAVHWVVSHGHVNIGELKANPVEAGRDTDGTPLYVAQAHHDGSVQPGKCSTKFDGALIPWGGAEENKHDYRVLCYNQ